ncbi:MAG: RluA family pseudouridine synthase [Treponema sp.]
MHKNAVRKTIPIVYEDVALCIVNKPYGIAVQGGAGITMPLTDILSRQLNTPIYPVHRLDKETAGLLITAKNPEAAAQCRHLFASRAVEKDYLAVCFGSSPEQQECCISTPIQEKGIKKDAVTEYRVLSRNADFTLFHVRLHTGRMHQIRIHLAGIGNPIIGDDKHGNFALNKQLWKQSRIRKLQLCAYRLTVPLQGIQRIFTIPLPDHIETALYTLGLSKA